MQNGEQMLKLTFGFEMKGFGIIRISHSHVDGDVEAHLAVDVE